MPSCRNAGHGRRRTSHGGTRQSGGGRLCLGSTLDFGSGNPASKGAEATIGIRAPGGLASSKQIVWSVGAPVVSDASLVQFTTTAIRITGDVDGDGSVTCSDMQVVKASFGKSATQQGFDPRADVNGDRLVNVLDLSIVSRGLPAGSKCP